MQIVVLAGGLGMRLRPLTENMPKSMIPIKGKPFLQYQLEMFKRNGIEDVVLCVGYLAEKIMSYFGDGSMFGIKINYNVEQEKLLGTAGAIRSAEPYLEEDFFITYGDSYLLLDYKEVMRYFKMFNRLGLMVVYKNFNRYDRSNVVVGDGFVKIYDKEKKTADMIYIDYGLSILKKKSLKLIPLNQVYSLETLFQHLIESKELLAFETNNRFYEIGSFSSLEEFKLLIDKGEL